MNINKNFNSDKEIENTLNTIDNLQKKEQYSVGFKAQNVPEK
jgi:hypothetical protein